MNFDIVIVGCGTGGCATGISLASKGYSVLMLDVKPRERIGIKTCGDATSAHYFERIKKYGLDILPPHGEELHQMIRGFIIVSPDRKHEYELEYPTMMIDRHKFGQRLLKQADASGCEIRTSTTVLGPIIENDRVIGVKTRKDGKIQELHAKIVVDASGIGAVIRRQLDPKQTYMDRTVLKSDVVYAYREIRKTESPIPRSDMCRIFFDQDLCPGGYYWVFPQTDRIINAGLGVEPTGDYPSAKKQFQSLYEKDSTYAGFDIKKSEMIHGGGAMVPLRRPIDSLVWNGVVLVGDSGCTVKPTDGGGIGLSIVAGAMAGKTIDEAIKKGDTSRDGLWSYNIEFMRKVAVINAPLAIIKRVIVKLTSEEINTIFSSGIMTQEDFKNINTGQGISLSVFQKSKRVLRGRKILRFLIRLKKASKRYDKAETLYKEFPESFDGFLEWRKKVLTLYQEPIIITDEDEKELNF